MPELSVLNLDGTNRNIKDASAVRTVSCNGINQTISSGSVDIDVASNLVPEEQWTQIQALLS